MQYLERMEIINSISTLAVVFAGVVSLAFTVMIFAYLIGQYMSTLFD
jgi:hypothetical protein